MVVSARILVGEFRLPGVALGIAVALAVVARAPAATEFGYDLAGNLASVTQASNAPPVITGQPVSQVLAANGTAHFSVIATGNGPLAYQWLSNGLPIAGATADALTVSNLVVPPNLITNGGFELPLIQASYVTYAAPAVVGGWTVESGTADVIYTYWLPHAGRQSLDLNGTSTGVIYRDVPTVPGQQYFLHYALAGSPTGAPVTKTNEVWWNGAPLDTNTFVTTDRTVDNMGWTNREHLVTATSNTTRVRFASLIAGSYGSALDAVSLVAVSPPPVQYSVIVSNSSGSVTSAVATVEFDSDGNGLPDAWERTWFATVGFAAAADNDGDGVSNGDEFLDGTNPASAASFRPRLQITFTPGGAAGLSPLRSSYALNEMVQLTAVPDSGHTFIGWFKSNSTNTNAVVNLTLTNNVSLLAIFAQTLINGANHDGTVAPLGTNIYTVAAKTGDTIIVRSGRLSGMASFQPYLQLIGPNGVQIDTDYNATDAFISYRTTNAGLFRVLMTSAYPGNGGEYRLRLAQAPGAFVVPPFDEGGALTNGAAHAGVTEIGDEDLWSFTANAGDQIVLRCGKVSGSASFAPWVRLYGTNGLLLASDFDYNDTSVSYSATNSGTFNVVVGSAYRGYTGAYQLHFLRAPGTFVIPPGDEGGPLTNGAAHSGITTLGDEDPWTFTANAGDQIVLRSGKISGSASYAPYIRLYGANGALLASDFNYNDSYVAYRTTNSGTFTVFLDSAYQGYTGNYQLHFMRIPGAFMVPPGDEGGPLANGGAHDGTNTLGDEDIWSFTANTGDQIVLRAGRVSGSASYTPWIRLYNTNGLLLGSEALGNDTYLAYRTTNAGTFTVLIGSFNAGYTGSYQLHFARSPGAFVVPPGDEGGPLINGGQHDGATTLGDEDIWSVTGNSGDTVVLRCAKLSGTASYAPWVRLYGTNGNLLDDNAHASDAYATYRLTNSGTFNVLVGSYNAGHSGTYRLRLAKAPGTFIVPAGDEGGLSLTGSTNDAVTELGDEDLWTLTAFKGVPLSLSSLELSGTASYAPWLRLYGVNGVLLSSSVNASLATINYTPTYSGTFTLLMGSANVGHTGTYRLTGTGYSEGLNVTPGISGTNLTFTGSGGGSNAQFILMMTTNLAQPLTLWTPIRTNNFNGAGAFSLTNFYDLNLPRQFFQLLVP